MLYQGRKETPTSISRFDPDAVCDIVRREPLLIEPEDTELTAITGGATVRTAVFMVPPKLAEMVAGVELVTGLVVIVKVAVVPAAGTVTVAGTEAAAVLLLVRETTAPALGAGPVKTTVP